MSKQAKHKYLGTPTPPGSMCPGIDAIVKLIERNEYDQAIKGLKALKVPITDLRNCYIAMERKAEEVYNKMEDVNSCSGCKNLNRGRFCLLGQNHCIRQAEDYYAS